MADLRTSSDDAPPLKRTRHKYTSSPLQGFLLMLCFMCLFMLELGLCTPRVCPSSVE